MNCMIDSDGSRIARLNTAVRMQRRKFRMAVFKTADMSFVANRAAARLQVAVAMRATFVACRDDVHAPPMFGVASRAARRVQLRCVMNRPIMACQAGRIAGLRGDRSRGLYVARGALRFQHGMRFAHPPARIHARILRIPLPHNPNERKRWHPNAEPELRAL